MRKVNGLAAIVAGLTLLFQAGATVAWAQQLVGGVQSLPSTSTEAGAPLAGLGAILMTLGAYLLRRPIRRPN